MRTNTIILLLFSLPFISFSQDIKSKADKYFYSYNYEQAISEYKKDMAKGELISNHQLLNLADSYFSLGNFEKASKIYVDINNKDTILSNHRFNKMLQSLAKSTEINRVKGFLNSRKNELPSELLEHANFNYQLYELEGDTANKFKIFNLKSNSPQSDFSPAFYKEKLLFSSGRGSKSKKTSAASGEAYYDIFIGRITANGDVLNPNIFKGMPNSKYHKTTPYYSEESGEIFYVLSNTEDGELSFDDKGKNALAMGLVDKNGSFSFLLRDLSTSFYYPYFDDAKNRLYFAANFKDGYGGTDLYYVSINNGQITSEPINLGPMINTPGNEIAPYFLGNEFYFSSDVFYGLGGMDIYKSTLGDDTTFSIPVNLGSGINTSKDEFGFILKQAKDGTYTGYFASNRSRGKGKDDIYGFTTSGLIGPKTLIVKGEVHEPKYQQGIPDAIVKVLDTSGKIIKEIATKSDGTFRVEIMWREDLTIKIEKRGYSSFHKSFEGESLKELKKEPLSVQLLSFDDVVAEKEGKQVIAVDKFFFARGKSNLTPSICSELDKIVEVVQNFSQLQFQIETHTNSRGSTRTNKAISQKRANAMRDYLVQKGVPRSNITGAIGYGEEKIKNKCKNGVYCLDFLHKQNERTLFVIQNYKQLSTVK